MPCNYSKSVTPDNSVVYAIESPARRMQVPVAEPDIIYFSLTSVQNRACSAMATRATTAGKFQGNHMWGAWMSIGFSFLLPPFLLACQYLSAPLFHSLFFCIHSPIYALNLEASRANEKLERLWITFGEIISHKS